MATSLDHFGQLMTSIPLDAGSGNVLPNFTPGISPSRCVELQEPGSGRQVAMAIIELDRNGPDLVMASDRDCELVRAWLQRQTPDYVIRVSASLTGGPRWSPPPAAVQPVSGARP